MTVEIKHSRVATLVDGPSNDGYDANEIQSSDWNDNHVITGAANSVLARAAATDGAVSEVALSASQLLGRGSTGDIAPITLGSGLSMTGTELSASGGGGGPVWDAGTLTASTPFEFKQTWDNAAQDVTFKAFDIVITNDDSGQQGAYESDFFRIKSGAAGSETTKLAFGYDALRLAGSIALKNGDVDTGDTAILLDPSNVEMAFGDPSVDEEVTVYRKVGAHAKFASPAGSGFTQSIIYGAFGPQVDAGLFTLPAETRTALAQWPDVPTSSEIADGYSQVGIDTNTGNVYLAANVGGTIFKVQMV